ncbi:MAG TPA: hypothetical protein VLT36_15105 [Candidatus Dormibacteraeota bacterium]|nr:hypothetical protein [Candidatus Dormibacteraeota bacterium]
MKKQLLIVAMTVLAGSLLAAEGGAKEEVVSAAKKLAEKPNYSWKTTVVVPESAPFKPGPTEGQTEKDGFIHVKMNFRDNTTELVKKGDKVAFTNPDGDWQTPADAENDQGPGRFMAGIARNFKAPAAQATEIAEGTKDLKKDGEVYSGDLTDEGAGNLMRFRRGGNGAPTIKDAKGSAKFWVKDGVLSKYEFKVTGSMNFNGNDMDVDRTTTIEIKDVGNTKVEVPEGAKKKLQ